MQANKGRDHSPPVQHVDGRGGIRGKAVGKTDVHFVPSKTSARPICMLR